MITIKEAILVEGKYDKIKLSQIVDTSIICSDGFRIYKDKEMITLLKNISLSSGLIILTDSDSAGFRIRNFVKNKLSDYPIKHAFIPDIYGKESRKQKPSKEGMLGVEGMEDEIIKEALIHCGATFFDKKEEQRKPFLKLTKLDLYKAGLSGRKNSKEKRMECMKKIFLPQKMSANMLLDVLNTMLFNHHMEEEIKQILNL